MIRRYIQTVALVSLASLLGAGCIASSNRDEETAQVIADESLEEQMQSMLNYVNGYEQKLRVAHPVHYSSGKNLAREWTLYLSNKRKLAPGLAKAVVQEALRDGRKSLELFASQAIGLGTNPSSEKFQKGQKQLDEYRRMCTAALEQAISYSH